MIDDSTTPEEAIRLAMQREKAAFEFYTKAAKIAKYPGTREMFESLAKEELRHARLLEEELNKDYYKEM
ncbi:MAG TPA: ferritin family protein [Thermodesulfobacteriota bacterium]|jgi:rubrerythrin|nr:ferritin family protein [Thermodesulfobacteriota bacterium]